MHKSNPTTRHAHEDNTNNGKRRGRIFHDLTAFQRDILIILAGCDAPAGVDVRADLTAYHETSVEPSRLYQALTKLADNHLIDISQQDGRTNAYQLTTHGERVLAAGREFKAMVGGEGND